MSTKIFLGLAIVMLTAFAASSNIYDVSIQTINGTTINLSTYEGKKMIVTEFDVANYDTGLLRTLDSLQKANSDAQVIAVPAKDFSSSVTAPVVKTMVFTLNLSFIITQPGFVKRAAGGNQDPIFKWLTHVNENTHFDIDADQPGEIYMISEKGELYAVLQKGSTIANVNDLATQKFD